MELKHKKPCSECPWRLVSPAGWLGGYSPEYYTDAVMNNEIPACHNSDFGPDSSETAMCAGALSVMANACISAWKQEGGEEARKEVGTSQETFYHPTLFYTHHSQGKKWQHPLERQESNNE